MAIVSGRICGANMWLTTDVIGLGFASCGKDCVGAAATDFLLAVHAFISVARTWWRVHERRRVLASQLEKHTERVIPGGLSFGTIACGLMFANGVWSLFGALYWLQPGGRKIFGFEIIWRLNAQCQAALLFFYYMVGISIVRISGLCPAITRHERLCVRFALAHAGVFGAICLLPSACQQHEYVLWGGINIMPPLLSQWFAILLLVRRYRLDRVTTSSGGAHPLYRAAISGVVFWLGNSGILFGRNVGVAKWLRDVLSLLLMRCGVTDMPLATEAWEEMATFHVFGMVGNDLLFRTYAWIALREVEQLAEPTPPPTAAAIGSASKRVVLTRGMVPAVASKSDEKSVVRVIEEASTSSGSSEPSTSSDSEELDEKDYGSLRHGSASFIGSAWLRPLLLQESKLHGD